MSVGAIFFLMITVGVPVGLIWRFDGIIGKQKLRGKSGQSVGGDCVGVEFFDYADRCDFAGITSFRPIPSMYPPSLFKTVRLLK